MKHTCITNATASLHDGNILFFSSGAFEWKNHLFLKLCSAQDASFLSKVLKDKKGSFGECFSFILPESLKQIIAVCTGEQMPSSLRKLEMLTRKALACAKNLKLQNCMLCLEDLEVSGVSAVRLCETVATNVELAMYHYRVFKEAPKDGWKDLEHIIYLIKDKSKQAGFQKALDSGSVIGGHVNSARDLANCPGGDMTPTWLSQEAQRRGKELGISVKVLGEKEMEKLGMGAILGVSRGSVQEAKLIVMEYQNGLKSQKPIVFVGKGITFDTGGINLKPSAGLGEMHMDMSGGASVLHAVCALAQLGAKVNVIGIIPAAENMPSGSSYRPGDVLRSMSGKTIEIGNTDAEGRVVMADAFTYAEKYDPSLVIDIATLTGACMVALGDYAFAVMSPSDNLAKKVQEAGQNCGDYCWPLPLWEEYEQDVKGTVGDVLNAAKNHPRGGAINAASFLHQFAKKFPLWIHFDIASTMTNYSSSLLAPGASGSGTRLLIEMARNPKEFINFKN